MRKTYKLIFSCIILLACNTNHKVPDKQEQSDSNKTELITDCIFDIRAFEMSYLDRDPDFSNFSWDSIRKIGLGTMQNGNILKCSVFVCDTWGFDALYSLNDSTKHFRISQKYLIELFDKLPTTPEKNRFIKKIKQINHVQSSEKGIYEYNLSEEDLEFLINIDSRKEITYVRFRLTSYY